MTFKVGQTVVGTASLSGGAASYTMSPVSLAAGTYYVTASYAGSSTDSASTSGNGTIEIFGAVESTKTTLALSSSQVQQGQGMTAESNGQGCGWLRTNGNCQFLRRFDAGRDITVEQRFGGLHYEC